MNKERLHGLTDGIFAIVMTLLVLDLKLPKIASATNGPLLDSLWQQRVIFLSYFISFAVLFVYWRAHNFLVAYLAKTIDVQFLNVNGIFLFLVGLVPFTTHFLGLYSHTQTGISIYAINVALIGLSLLYMRLYIEHSPNIDNIQRTPEQVQGALIRILVPVIFALSAIPISFLSTTVAYGILLLAVAYNFYPNAYDLTRRILGKTIFGRLFEAHLNKIVADRAN